MADKVYIGFGSNLGIRELKFKEALHELNRAFGIAIKKSSRLYETDPVDLSDDGPKFLNAVIEIETTLKPRELMQALKAVEMKLGKSPRHRSDQSRHIDLDLLLYGDLIIREDDLNIPHPRMHKRGFVLVPLAEIAPETMHPVSKLTIRELVALIAPEELGTVRALGAESNRQ
jgi:2-amino-4-hydroxy-6-hydroxymethyldihydropteridine diphosphokinase